MGAGLFSGTLLTEVPHHEISTTRNNQGISHYRLQPHHASAANLPKSTGADLSKTGTVQTLVPIVQMRAALLKEKGTLQQAKAPDVELFRSLSETLLLKIPNNEDAFKKRFDEYSIPVSYKQKYMEKNAFLVYYTKGFDGPNRPSIETPDALEDIQKNQYGARNDAWSAIDDLYAELTFADGTLDDVVKPLARALNAMDGYLQLAPKAQLDEAQLQVQ
jgi:hypothetical protein